MYPIGNVTVTSSKNGKCSKILFPILSFTFRCKSAKQ